MLSTELEKQLAFLTEIERLKTVLRANKTLDGRFENSAEHSWHITLMALILANYAQNPFDLLKVTKMLLIHDIVEIDAGDTWLFAEDQSTKQADETAAAQRIFSLLPEPQKKEYLNLWHEFEAQQTEEAKFAAVIDGLQPLLNHVITGNPDEGAISVENVWSKKQYIQTYTPQLWPLAQKLITEGKEKRLYS